VISHATEDFTTINYMHVRSSGDPIEITGKRDSLSINCDISECTHVTTHTLDVPMRIAHPRQEEFIHCRDCAEEAGCLEAVNWHMYFANFCMTM
jgi:hypothetical protein